MTTAHFIDISVAIEKIVKLKDVANERFNEKSERELGRELERENRRLRSKIDSMKRSENESERENVYFSRDERCLRVQT